MRSLRAHERIAAALREQGLDARPVDGWVYVKLADGRLLCISAEYGESLDADVYDETPAWFERAPIAREPLPPPRVGTANETLSTLEKMLLQIPPRFDVGASVLLKELGVVESGVTMRLPIVRDEQEPDG